MATNDNCITYKKTRMTITSYWNSVEILVKKPHVVNKKLWGSILLFRMFCKPGIQIRNLLNLVENIEKVEQYEQELLKRLQGENCRAGDPACVEIILLELLPKSYTQNHAFQLIVFMKEDLTVAFYDVTPKSKPQKICPIFPYSLQLVDDCVYLNMKSCSPNSCCWLKTTLFSQFVKWGEENVDTANESLALVCVDKYYQKYNDLKLKYGKDMVKIWPECTDPSKFVYEDVAIATYLLLLWEDERDSSHTNTPQSFVDLGCGNGLLVYILTQEGHKGVGIDVRKRQIWDLYPKNIQLEEKTITPSDDHLFPETNWIIGNHSDELTPWIPVIAATSSYNCNFFLLPCCAYNFDGSKYQRQNSSIRQYTEYLQYILSLCNDCGFKVDSDRLKIPSTKRICIVGRGRTYSIEEHRNNCQNIKENIISSKNSFSNPEIDKSCWVKEFKARETTERVRNCTQLDKAVVESIVKVITNYLLEDCKKEASDWCIGKTIGIGDLVYLIPDDKMKTLKSECGGLQTLLKNHHHIFQVQSGKVHLRYPKTVDEVNKKIDESKTRKKIQNFIIQQKPCWFFNNHPQGCPLPNNVCSFLHVTQ